MLFNSWIFVVFFLAFLPVYLLVRKNLPWRNSFLLISSYIFYGWWDARFLILVAISTSVDFIASLGASGQAVSTAERLKSVAFLVLVGVVSLSASERTSGTIVVWTAMAICVIAAAFVVLPPGPKELFQRRYWLCLSLVINLGILAFFKYANFFTSSVVEAASFFGLALDVPTLRIVLPVGLSFYTFQAISRTVDSFRGTFVPGRSLIDYAAYHAFFPQLVAGPIERAAHLMPQFERVLPITRKMVVSGALLFLWGLYKKAVVADNLAEIADQLFDNPASMDASAAISGVLAFSFQIYCDFSGYSDMAKGLARILGFDLMTNFNLPYFARTPSEFWQRWHISLSSWLRDYLYIPLGGNRGSELNVYRNLMVTMLLGGLWHGAAWTFIAWGALHGAYLVLFRKLRVDRLLDSAKGGRLAIHAFSWATTMLLVAIGWIFFRARTFALAWAVLSRACNVSVFRFDPFHPLLYYLVPLVAIEIYQQKTGHTEFMLKGPFLVRYSLALFLILSIVALTPWSGRQFIYFDF